MNSNPHHHAFQANMMFSSFGPGRNSRAKIVIATLCYFGALSYVYAFYVSTVFAYERFTYEPVLWEFIAATVLLFGFTAILPSQLNLNFALNGLILLLIYVPTLVLWSLGPAEFQIIAVSSIALLTTNLVSRFAKPQIPKLFYLSKMQLFMLLVVLIGLYFLGVFAQGGAQFFNLDLLLVYEIRDSAAENLHWSFNYLSPIIGKVAVPLLAVYGVATKNKYASIAGIFAGIMIFAFTAHKAPILYGIGAVFIFFIYQSAYKFVFWTACCLSLVLILAIIDFEMLYAAQFDYNSGWGLFSSFFARRGLLIPSLLNTFWVDFFSSNKFLYWSESSITFGLFQSPYQLKPTYLIGLHYFGVDNQGANTGWIGSGYANGGWLGVILYSILIGLFISYLQRLAQNVSEAFIIGASFPVFSTIVLSSDLFTSILTHGLLGLLFLLTLICHKGFGFPKR